MRYQARKFREVWGVVMILLAGCAGTRNPLPQCHGRAVPINAPAKAPDAHGN